MITTTRSDQNASPPRVRVLFAIDACDREVMAWLATSAGISGEMVRDPMGRLRRASIRDQQGGALSDNGSAYIAKDTLDTATALGLKLCFTPVLCEGAARSVRVIMVC
jgi:putative transposase